MADGPDEVEDAEGACARLRVLDGFLDSCEAIRNTAAAYDVQSAEEAVG